MMTISGQTKVADVIKADKRSIDAIASVAKPLAKLKNPLLRKIMAPRVTLAEASKIGGCSLDAMIDVLTPLGFLYLPDNSEQKEIKKEEPAWLTNLEENRITKFDVREMLEAKADPLKEIMTKFKTVAEGNALCIIVGFEPVPLVNKLTKKGTVKAFTRQISPTEYHSFFYKLPASELLQTNNDSVSSEKNKKGGAIIKDSEAAFAAICGKFDKAHTKTLDVRTLEMPGPRMKILEELESLPGNTALYVFHKRVPLYLLEDLAEEAVVVHIYEIGEGNVRMLLYKIT